MAGEPEHGRGMLSTRTMTIILLLTGGATFAFLKGFGVVAVAAASVVISEIVVAAALCIAAGGYTYPLLRRVMPASAPQPLRVLTAVLTGLWLMSTALLTVGAAIKGAMTAWLWWPVVIVGVLAAAWQVRGKLGKFKPAGRHDARALVWIAVALAAGIWFAGATVPPGLIGGTDGYDVLEYHLQAPREYLQAGQITPLKHNCYSFYPMGMEMLFLLGMILRGGAYEGMYLAKMMHGAFAVIAVAAVFLSLRRDEDARGRFSAALLAGVPMVLYLSWLAMVELAMVAYLTLALLWLRHWSKSHCSQAAICIGLMVGGACAIKYLSVGFVAAPVGAVMLACSLRKWRRLAHVGIVAAMAAAIWSPWLIRNVAVTGNAVFPLATSVFGRGHWDEQTEKRWVDGHSAESRPPVPVPEGWQRPADSPGRLENLFNNFISSDMFGPALLLLAGAAICALVAAKKGPPPLWDWMLIGVCAVQLTLWTAVTRDMPARFLMPIVVPICLLAGGVLAKLSQVRANPFSKDVAASLQGRWGATAAMAIFVVITLTNVFTSVTKFSRSTGGVAIPPWPGQLVAEQMTPFNSAANLPAGSKLLLVGEAKAFYFPPGTVYATAFDIHPLDRLLRFRAEPSASQIRSRLRAMGVTHILVNWSEIRRLARTYGYPASLTGKLLATGGSGPSDSLNIFDAMGLRAVKHLNRPCSDDEQPRPSSTTQPTGLTYATLYVIGDS